MKRLLCAGVAGFVYLQLLVSVASAQVAGRGGVTLPLTHYEKLLQQLSAPPPPAPRPPVEVVWERRSVEGRLDGGMLHGTLRARFTLLSGRRHVRVPMLASSASIARVRLDGKPATPQERGGMHTVGVEKAGSHEVEVSFLLGQKQDRFARRLRLALPAAGATALKLVVPEQPIVAELAGGVVTATRATAKGTAIEGQLAATGTLDLRWRRRLMHKGSAKVRLEARVDTLFAVSESLVKGLARIGLTIREGETDRIDLRLPAGVEVLAVKGPAVLQWQADERTLKVFLRHLARGKLGFVVRFQQPMAPGGDAKAGHGRVALAPISLPSVVTAARGSVGIQAPAGLSLEVLSRVALTPVPLADLASELTSLTKSPLLVGFNLDASKAKVSPSLRVTVKRLQAVKLTSTLIDGVEASTVVLADGTEISKLRLSVRNNTRQYLKVRLPAGAELTASLLDGHPVRPALASSGAQGRALLLPLRQSERVQPRAGRSHRVKPNETLGDIAHTYYGDPGKWRLLLEANRGRLSSARALRTGQRLRVPSAGRINVEESSFVVELAYRRRGAGALGLAGRRRLVLPKLDVDALRVTWHVYLPDAIAPLSFDANLTQYTAIRYGLLRRAKQFLRRALQVRKAWAGGLRSKYESILSRRKGIYRARAERKSKALSGPAAFPLVGKRYRFKRILAQRDQPTVVLTYLDKGLLGGMRFFAFALAAGLAFLLTIRRRPRWLLLLMPILVFGLLYAAHHLPGVHRRLLWGATLGLASSLAWRHGRDALRCISGYLWAPWRLLELCRWGNLAMALGVWFLGRAVLRYPLLLSSLCCVALLIAHGRVASRQRRLVSSTGTKIAGAIMALLLSSVAAPALAEGDPRNPDRAFSELMREQNRPFAAKRGSAGGGEATSVSKGDPRAVVRLPLGAFHQLWRRLRATPLPAQGLAGRPAVVLGEARYRGKAAGNHLELRVDLRVELGRQGRWKSVPLVGRGAILRRVSVNGRAVPTSTRRGYHVWVTRKSGEISLTLDIIVPPRGPRGSIEYDFVVAKTPVTTLELRFPEAGLEPRVDQAVASRVESVDKQTLLTATLRPTTRIHLLGFRDLGDKGQRRARLYAETLNLVSVDEGQLEVFSVLRYTILYAGQRRFEVRIPEGMSVVSANGKGAFRYTLHEKGAQTTLRGATARPMRGSYEISLRLRRALAKPKAGSSKGEQVPFSLPLPRPEGVVREAGWVAVEATGKLRLRQRALRSAVAVDVRQLPHELLRSAVSAVLFAYRYHAPGREIRLALRPLPEAEAPLTGIDRARAFSVVSAEGNVLTELRLTLRASLRRSLRLRLGAGMRVRSALLDGAPIKPSRDKRGHLVLPLRRSRRVGNDRLTLQVILEDKLSPLRWGGRPRLALPAVSLPISSLAWSVFLPARNHYSRLHGPQGWQRRSGSGSWSRPRRATSGAGRGHVTSLGEGAVASLDLRGLGADGGAMPVRIKLPKDSAGNRLEHQRFWIGEDEPVAVSFRYVSVSLLYPMAALLWLALLAALVLGVGAQKSRGRRRRFWVAGGAVVAVVVGASLANLAGGGLCYLAALVALALLGWRRRWLPRAFGHVLGWQRTLVQRWRDREGAPNTGPEALLEGPPCPRHLDTSRSLTAQLGRLSTWLLLGAFGVVGLMLLTTLLRILHLLTHPF